MDEDPREAKLRWLLASMAREVEQWECLLTEIAEGRLDEDLQATAKTALAMIRGMRTMTKVSRRLQLLRFLRGEIDIETW